MAENQAAPAAEPSFRETVEKAEQSDAQSQTRDTAPEKESQAETSEQAQAPEPEKTVPLKALHEARALTKSERQARQQLERQTQEMQRQQLEMLNYIASMQPQRQMPDKTQDPLGYQIALTEQLANQQQNFQQQTFQQRQQEWQVQAAAVAEQQFVSAARQQNQEFVAQQPDANEGINWLKSNRVAQYEAFGMTKQEATARMLSEERELVAGAMQRAENPAEVAYKMARAAGYVPAKEKLEMRKDGAGASLPTQGGGAGGNRVSLDALAKLKGTDFLEATKGGKWKQLMSRT